MKLGFVRAVCIAAGLLYVVTGGVMLLAPEWFFQNVGNFPPFNRHYIGDLGSFNLPLGIALLWAARNPSQHRLVIALGALASLIHALNHAYDDVIAQTPLAGWFSQTLPLLITALFIAAAYWMIQRASVR